MQPGITKYFCIFLIFGLCRYYSITLLRGPSRLPVSHVLYGPPSLSLGLVFSLSKPLPIQATLCCHPQFWDLPRSLSQYNTPMVFPSTTKLSAVTVRLAWWCLITLIFNLILDLDPIAFDHLRKWTAGCHLFRNVSDLTSLRTNG